MALMTVEQVLHTPPGECDFQYPSDAYPSQIDRKYETLRIERRGLRKWTCLEENPAHLLAYLSNDTPYQVGWKPHITSWQRYAASERIVQDVYASSLIHRVNVALDVVAPNHLSIIGTPRQFPSWGTETSRLEGEEEKKIAPDWVLVYGDGRTPPNLANLDDTIIAWGDTKLKTSGDITDTRILPGTYACPEPYLAQVVQYCIDMDFPLGFLLTNYELVIFQVIRYDPREEEQISTRATSVTGATGATGETDRGVTTWPIESSSSTEETGFSSPLQRTTEDWFYFDHGDSDIPFIGDNSKPASLHNSLHSPSHHAHHAHHGPVAPSTLTSQFQAQQVRQQGRHTTPEISNSSQESSLNPDNSPCPSPRNLGRHNPNSPSSQAMSWVADIRAEDPTHVLIKAYRTNETDENNVARRLFELCMLAKAAKDRDVLGIGPRKLSFACLDTLDTT